LHLPERAFAAKAFDQKRKEPRGQSPAVGGLTLAFRQRAHGTPTMKLAFTISCLCLSVAMTASLAYPKKIGVMISRRLPSFQETQNAFQNKASFDIVLSNIDGNLQEGKSVLQQWEKSDVQLVVVIGNVALQAASAQSLSKPLLYTLIARPPVFSDRRSASGILLTIPPDEQFAFLRKLFPKATRLGVIYTPENSGGAISEARNAAGRHGFSLLPIAIESESEIPASLEKLSKDQIDVLWSVLDEVVSQPKNIQLMLAHGLKQDLPFVGLSSYHVKAGAAVAFSPDFTDLGKQAVSLAEKILAQPGAPNLVETPRAITIYLNKKTLDAIGVRDVPALPNLEYLE
jgi:putative tryptophan/tyrosine transport system substrate-binding protein